MFLYRAQSSANRQTGELIHLVNHFISLENGLAETCVATVWECVSYRYQLNYIPTKLSPDYNEIHAAYNAIRAYTEVDASNYIRI